MMAAVRAELLKLRTVRLWWALLIGIVLGSAGLAALTAIFIGSNGPGGSDTAATPIDAAAVRSAYTAGLTVTYLCTMALGVIVMAGERHHRTLTATVLANPRRWRVVLAKLGAIMIAGVGYGIAGAAASVAAAAPIFASRGVATWLGEASTLRALALGVLAVALWGVLGLGLGTLIPNQIVAIVISIVVALVVEPLVATVLNAFNHGAIAQYLPSQATGALVSPNTTNGQGFNLTLLPWWGGALVLAGYALGFGGLGAGLTLRRDVT